MTDGRLTREGVETLRRDKEGKGQRRELVFTVDGTQVKFKGAEGEEAGEEAGEGPFVRHTEELSMGSCWSV